MPYKNKEDRNKQSKRWVKNNPEKRKATTKKYKDSHREEAKVYRKSYAKRRNELLRNSTKKLAEENPLALRIKNCVKNANKRARKMGVKGKLTEPEVAALFNTYGNICIGCHNEMPGLDHVIPLSKGGLNVIGNCQPLGLNCNFSKNIGCTDFRKKG